VSPVRRLAPVVPMVVARAVVRVVLVAVLPAVLVDRWRASPNISLRRVWHTAHGIRVRRGPGRSPGLLAAL